VRASATSFSGSARGTDSMVAHAVMPPATTAEMIIIAKRRDGFSGCVKMSTFSPL